MTVDPNLLTLNDLKSIIYQGKQHQIYSLNAPGPTSPPNEQPYNITNFTQDDFIKVYSFCEMKTPHICDTANAKKI